MRNFTAKDHAGCKCFSLKKMISKIMSDHPEDFIQFNTDHNTLHLYTYTPPN